ncbi:hypothetical protein OG799_01615 [Micromonospora sp. NBC_00898]|nr:hypothetical protein OG799_01615 [Micromonospora sp. NBC_00898]
MNREVLVSPLAAERRAFEACRRAVDRGSSLDIWEGMRNVGE